MGRWRKGGEGGREGEKREGEKREKEGRKERGGTEVGKGGRDRGREG